MHKVSLIVYVSRAYCALNPKTRDYNGEIANLDLQI